jgi:hypothetical protein
VHHPGQHWQRGETQPTWSTASETSKKNRVDRRAEIDINGTCGSGETKKATRPDTDTVDALAAALPLLWSASALQMRRRLTNCYSKGNWWV